jgi:hypothetical protein
MRNWRRGGISLQLTQLPHRNWARSFARGHGVWENHLHSTANDKDIRAVNEGILIEVDFINLSVVKKEQHNDQGRNAEER